VPGCCVPGCWARVLVGGARMELERLETGIVAGGCLVLKVVTAVDAGRERSSMSGEVQRSGF
jgi:hypothetical protein